MKRVEIPLRVIEILNKTKVIKSTHVTHKIRIRASTFKRTYDAIRVQKLPKCVGLRGAWDIK